MSEDNLSTWTWKRYLSAVGKETKGSWLKKLAVWGWAIIGTLSTIKGEFLPDWAQSWRAISFVPNLSFRIWLDVSLLVVLALALPATLRLLRDQERLARERQAGLQNGHQVELRKVQLELDEAQARLKTLPSPVVELVIGKTEFPPKEVMLKVRNTGASADFWAEMNLPRSLTVRPDARVPLPWVHTQRDARLRVPTGAEYTVMIAIHIWSTTSDSGRWTTQYIAGDEESMPTTLLSWVRDLDGEIRVPSVDIEVTLFSDPMYPAPLITKWIKLDGEDATELTRLES